MYVCTKCDLEFTTSVLLYKHTRRNHSDSISIKHSNGRRETVEKNTNGKFTCPVVNCSKQYSTRDHLQRHCTDKHLITDICVESVPKAYKLRLLNGNFVDVVKTQSGHFQCPCVGCRNMYTRFSKLKQHFESHKIEYVSVYSQQLDPIPVSIPLEVNNNMPNVLVKNGMQAVSVAGMKLLVCKHCAVCILPENTSILQHAHSKKHKINCINASELSKTVLDNYLLELELSTIETIRESPYFKPATGSFPTAIPGLAIKNGYGCSKCNYISSSFESFGIHHRHENTHWKDTIVRNVTFQQLFRKPPFHSLSRVVVETELIVPKKLDWGLLLKNVDTISREAPIKSKMDPFLRKSFWVEYAQEIIPAATAYEHISMCIDSRSALKHLSTRKLLGLRAYVLSYYKMMATIFPKVDHAVLREIKASPNNHVFSPLWSPDSVVSYSNYLADFIYLVCLTAVNDYPHNDLSKHLVGRHVHGLFHTQIALLIQYLTDIMESANDSDFQYSFEPIHELLLSVFTYSSDEDSVLKSCQDPILRFHLLSCLQAGNSITDYGFRSVNHVTGPLSMLLYACRGVILMELTKEYWSSSVIHSSYVVAKKTFLPFCTDMGVTTTFTRLKHLKALASTMASVTPSFPKITNVSDNKEEFTKIGHPFSTTQLRHFVATLVKNIEKQLNTVLMSYNDGWVNNIVKNDNVLLDDFNNT